jgi:predicted transglutaminase-like cysteine proteinase
MQLARAVLPPAGYLDFCRRAPSDCGVDPAVALEGRTAALYRRYWREALAPMERPTKAEAAAPPLSPELWATLNEINRGVNGRLREGSDRELFGREDRWTAPSAEGRSQGDCEDFVLEKRRALLGRGVPRDALSIALVDTARGEPHAVLLVRTDRGEYVLDNRSPWISLWSQLDYRWRERQMPGDPQRWVLAAR